MPISRDEALDCFRSDDLIGIGMEADAVRRRLHPEGVVSYALRAEVGSASEVAKAQEAGATGVLLRASGLMGMEEAVRLVEEVKRLAPEMWVQGFSAADVAAMSADATARLRDAGLDAIGCGEAEVIDKTWLRVQRAAHAAGMRTTARIVFGAGESFAERVARLEELRQLQAETGGFRALAPVSLHSVGGRELDETTAVEALKTLAVARMFVENVENLETDWTSQGLKVLQMGLRFGANDVGVAGGLAKEEELRRVVRDAGFRVVERDLGYRMMMVG
jgi:cyclic dehypoxanthinyl futalosine synthase